MKQCSRYNNKEKPCLNPKTNENGYLDESEFGNKKKTKDGLTNHCKYCVLLDNKNNKNNHLIWYEENKERISKNSKENYISIDYGKLFIERATIIHNNKYDYSKVKYKHSLEKIIIICPKHGEFLQLPSSHLQGHKCLHCANKSNGEIIISEFFINKEIPYIYEKSFDDCRNLEGNKLSFDFYIPSLNTCIEYNGEGHFKPILIFKGIEGFENRKISDFIKYCYCKKIILI